MTNVRILHCHSTFSLGGKEARAVRLMNAFGEAARHTIISAVPEALGARDMIDPAVKTEFPDNAPSLEGKPSIERYRRFAGYMQRFDLILTYNWGAMDAVMTRRMFDKDVPPLVHHEDGFNADEAGGLNPKRNWFRRLGLPAAHALVVPSQTLDAIATNIWKQPRSRVHLISNGIDVAAYGKRTKRTIPGLKRQRGEIVVGTLAGLRPVKNLPMLVRAVATIPGAKLVIVGEGPEREAIIAEANRVGFAHRLVLPGFMAEPQTYIGHFDMFALSSHSEQFPISLVEAMAAGLSVAATDVGDVRKMVAPENERFIVRGEAALGEALRTLAADPALRAAIGRANRTRAVADYDAQRMIARYAALYEAAVGWPGALLQKDAQKLQHFPRAGV
jgi:L-malate glycosyltransferase